MQPMKSYRFRWRPRQEASLAPLCSNLRCFGNKDTALKYCSLLLTLLGPPQKFGARGIVPLVPVVTPLITARSDAPQQTMIVLVLSSSGRIAHWVKQPSVNIRANKNMMA